jgi:predicted GNAT superfamily acetyltransferase
MPYFNKIIRKSFDFVILDKQTMNALVAIELDDVSHERPNRILRDTFVNNAVGAANFPILHFKAEKEYNEENLLLELNKVLKPEQLAAQRP